MQLVNDLCLSKCSQGKHVVISVVECICEGISILKKKSWLGRGVWSGTRAVFCLGKIS